MKRATFLAVVVIAALAVAGERNEIQPVPDLARPDFAELERLPVDRVVDGDTIRVLRDGESVTVRLIGVDTPETVDTRQPVQRYGKAASLFLTNLLKGEDVWLRRDPAHLRDRFGRELAYVYRVPDGLNVNLEIVRQGYGHAYVKVPHPDIEAYRAAEKRARLLEKGLWAPDPGKAETPEQAATDEDTDSSDSGTAPPAADDPTVYVTKTGDTYHRAGCRYLAESSIPIRLSEAATRFEPCSACGPPR